jgi:uncharacterized DUF497 family protein
MEVTFDPVKNASNVRDRNLPFTLESNSIGLVQWWRKTPAKHTVSGAFGCWASLGSGCTPLFSRRARARCMSSCLRKANPREIKKYAETSKS